MKKSYKVELDGNEYEVFRSHLKDWLYLEEIKSSIRQAAEIKDTDDLVRHLFDYLSAAFSVELEWDKFDWIEVSKAFYGIQEINSLDFDFPLLRFQGDEKSVVWNYDGRTWYFWAHTLASTYGWSLDEIADLDPNDAVALLQEILVDDQLSREWQWGLSEVAYPYNAQTKKSQFKPLDRPAWMFVPVKTEKIKIPAKLVPVGKGIKLGEGQDAEH